MKGCKKKEDTNRSCEKFYPIKGCEFGKQILKQKGKMEKMNITKKDKIKIVSQLLIIKSQLSLSDGQIARAVSTSTRYINYITSGERIPSNELALKISAYVLTRIEKIQQL